MDYGSPLSVLDGPLGSGIAFRAGLSTMGQNALKCLLGKLQARIKLIGLPERPERLKDIDADALGVDIVDPARAPPAHPRH